MKEIRVALVTTWQERCGIAEYAYNLVMHMALIKDDSVNCSFVALQRPFSPVEAAKLPVDIVHLNYEPGLMPHWTASDVRKIQDTGKKVVLTLHTSHDGDNRTPFTTEFDRVIVHEKTTDGFDWIPMGIPVVRHRLFAETLNSNLHIGTAGFPFPWKGFHQVALAADNLWTENRKTYCMIIAPESNHVSTKAMRDAIYETARRVNIHYVDEWLPQDEVIRRLGLCDVNVFAYAGGNYGISAANRFGLATRRPLVLTRCRQFRDLFEYEDEIEFIPNQHPEEITAGIERVLNNGKKPNRILDDMSWLKSALLYKQLYGELT